MNRRIILGVIVMITLGATIVASPILLKQQSALAGFQVDPINRKAPPAITGDNVYVVWTSNKTGHDEVLFRASNDNGKTFGDKMNLSNTTNDQSTRVEIDSDVDSVVVTWWETNETSDLPVMRISNDNGKTFGPLLQLAANGTLGE
jgi:hypothetical protein